MSAIAERKPLDHGKPSLPSSDSPNHSQRRFRPDAVIAIAAVLALILLGAALLAPFIAPFDPDARCLYGLRLTLLIALFGAALGLALGALAGLVAGMVGGTVDAIIMGLCDVKIAIPFTLVALLVIAIAGASALVLVCVLSLAYWAQCARLIRAQVLTIREMPYIEAARAAGATSMRIAIWHVLPNIVSPVIVMFTLNISNLILLESSLSFLGLGVQPPTATLGSMVGLGRDYMATAPWVVASPAILIMLVSLTVMLLGDWLRDHLDVRLRER